MPLYCSKTGSTALREAEVQQPMTDATLSLTRSFLAFSAKVGQSLAPSSWINLILRPSTPPWALICSMASFSASTDPVSEIAMVPGHRMQNAYRDLAVGDGEPGGVDLCGRKLLRQGCLNKDLTRQHCGGRQRGRAEQQLAAERAFRVSCGLGGKSLRLRT